MSGDFWPPGNGETPRLPDLADLSVIARGGYAVVYRAVQESTGREVALRIDKRPFEGPQQRSRFEQEVRAAGRLSGHPNVVDLYTAGVTDDGRPYVVMELCQGSYADRLDAEGVIGDAEVRDIGIQLADALAGAHDHGVLHRDIKPANILVNAAGRPVLADFGLAVLTDAALQTGVHATIGHLTPAYAPLEVLQMQPSSPFSDVYSLAATLYALLAGHPPRFNGDVADLRDVMELSGRPIPDVAGASALLVGMLRAAMTSNPEGRPTAEQFREMLDSVPLAKPSTPPSVRRPSSPQPQVNAVPAVPVAGPAAPMAAAPGAATGTALRTAAGASTAAPPRPVPGKHRSGEHAIVADPVPGESGRHRSGQHPMVDPPTAPMAMPGVPPGPVVPSGPDVPPGPAVPPERPPARPGPGGPAGGPDVARTSEPAAFAPPQQRPAQPSQQPGPGPRGPAGPVGDRPGVDPTAYRTGEHAAFAPPQQRPPEPSGFAPPPERRPGPPKQGPGHTTGEHSFPPAPPPPGGPPGAAAWPPSAPAATPAPQPATYEPPAQPAPFGAPPDGPRYPGPPPEPSPEESSRRRLPGTELVRSRVQRRRESGESGGSRTKFFVVSGAVIVVVLVLITWGAVALFGGDEPDGSGAQQEPTGSAPVCGFDVSGLSCLTKPQCFDEFAIGDDGMAAATEAKCAEEHEWEAFASGELPEELESTAYQDVAAVELVQSSCRTKDVLKQLVPVGDLPTWTTDVLPPSADAFADGDRTFLCIARVQDQKLTGSTFVK